MYLFMGCRVDAQTHVRIDAYDISEEEYRELCKQPTAQMVVEAVTRYNELVSRSAYLEDYDVNELLIKAIEEEDAKVFLDEVFDKIEKKKIIKNNE
jgi:predicted metal-binding transcription factor (methanogenesis marker protein 9)